jgi:hypothetical protein
MHCTVVFCGKVFALKMLMHFLLAVSLSQHNICAALVSVFKTKQILHESKRKKTKINLASIVMENQLQWWMTSFVEETSRKLTNKAKSWVRVTPILIGGSISGYRL